MNSPTAPGGRPTAVDVNFEAGTLHSLRARVTACARAAGMPAARAADVMVAVSELAANTVRHGPGRGRLRVRVAGSMLRCVVSDDGTASGPWPVRHGHGLWIARALADQLTIAPGNDGSLVTVVFAISRDHPDRAAVPACAELADGRPPEAGGCC